MSKHLAKGTYFIRNKISDSNLSVHFTTITLEILLFKNSHYIIYFNTSQLNFILKQSLYNHIITASKEDGRIENSQTQFSSKPTSEQAGTVFFFPLRNCLNMALEHQRPGEHGTVCRGVREEEIDKLVKINRTKFCIACSMAAASIHLHLSRHTVSGFSTW